MNFIERWLRALGDVQPELSFDSDRSAMTVVPRAAFLKWLTDVSGTPVDRLRKSVRQDQTVYLVPFYEGSWNHCCPVNSETKSEL